MGQSILLEAGTNELELLVFRLGQTPFGINVAKVREIIQPRTTIKIPYAPAGVEGSFKIREEVLTLINLGRYLNIESDVSQLMDRMVIVVELNQTRCGILVDEVQRIFRLKWEQIQAPSQYLIDLDAPISGTVNIDQRVILIADFETIVGRILNVQSIEVTEEPATEIPQQQPNILLADDSSLVRLALIRNLKQKGFTRLTVCNDGQHAWETIESKRHDPDGPFDLVLSDIEMPRMDGFSLTKRIKEDPELNHIPVVLFSSLINEANLHKGQSVGADAQISKPNGERLFQTITSCLNKAQKTTATATS